MLGHVGRLIGSGALIRFLYFFIYASMNYHFICSQFKEEAVSNTSPRQELIFPWWTGY